MEAAKLAQMGYSFKLEGSLLNINENQKWEDIFCPSQKSYYGVEEAVEHNQYINFENQFFQNGRS